MSQMDDFNVAVVLAHSGVKGQQWGVRNYQNPDGSLTPLGRERRRKGTKKERAKAEKVKAKIEKAKAKQAKKDHKKAVQEIKEQETIEQKKARIMNSRSAEEVYRNASLFTTKELGDIAARFQAEENLSRYFKKEKQNPAVELLKSAGKKTSESVTKAGADLIGDLVKSVGKNQLEKILKEHGIEYSSSSGNNKKKNDNNN